MKLTELEAGFVSTGGFRTGLHFLCPRCRRQQLVVPFANPPSNGAPDASLNHRGVLWRRTGATLEDITLEPSVDALHVNGGVDGAPREECRWHGWVRNGEVIDA